MKTEKRWRPSPPVIVTLTALIVIAGMLLAGWLNTRRYRVKARVEIAEPAIELQSSQSSPNGTAAELPDGEVARTALRVREATGLLMGLTMLAVNEQMSNRSPVNVDALLILMAKRTLLPPGIQQTSAQGTLVSDRATISVRYRPVPLGIEVVSLSNERTYGPAVIARLAADGDDKSGAVLLIAKKAEAPIPAPFASLSQIIATGWNVEPLRERSFAAGEIEQLNAWAQQYGITNR
jgi:hypothetical protein